MKPWNPVPWLRDMQAALDTKDDVRPGMAADRIEALEAKNAELTDYIAEAAFSGKPVMAEFNSRVLLAEPGDTAADVLREWDQDQQRSYFGEVKF